MKFSQKNLILVCMIGILCGMIIATLPPAPPPIIITSPFIYSFNTDGILNETGTMQDSSSPYWWINAGGSLVLKDSVGMTMQGDASLLNKWRLAYALANPLDTDKGLHPQNLFRLITKSAWENVRAQAWFMVTKDNFSASPNRNASNGLLLMNRYMSNGQTLYYAGIRVDGTAVIKKKYNGAYYTMAQTKVFSGTYAGSQDTKNLIPHNQWIGLRTTTVTNADGSVTMALFMQSSGQSTWSKLLEVTDRGQYGSTKPIIGPGYSGIRTDFMDVRFDSFRLEKI